MILFKSKKIKHSIEDAINLAIFVISEDIQRSSLEEENKIRAESIKALAEAYDIVHRGKKTHEF
jgi:hypothetical protein